MSKNKFDDYLYEEELFLEDRKKYKKERKIKSLKDRSKYKKTNLEKQKTESEETNLQKARVLSILGEEILVSFDNKKFICTLRGFLKKERTKNKNLIAPGDIANISFKNEKEAVIESIDKRFSILSRMEEKTKKRSIIAVNIDQVLITTSVVKPPLKPFLIDRYLIVAEKENMKGIIIINKIDLLKEDKEEKNKFINFVKDYQDLGYLIIPVSCKTKTGLDTLLEIMKGKSSVFSGQSGCGKSSIINAILHTKLKTKEVIEKTYKGAHVTTKAELIEIENNGFCIDTPGIKSFGIWELTIEDVKNHFFEFNKYSKKCRYPDCLHINEPDCAIKNAVKKNKISTLRFEAYSSLIEEIQQRKIYE
jgi:ribosome biogenesis GTPase / thiamine phosphate phosphatase